MTVLQSFHLNGKLALITGSSAGIGFALARALGEAGVHVILNGRNAEKVAVANKIPYQSTEQYFKSNPAGTTESKLYVVESKILKIHQFSQK